MRNIKKIIVLFSIIFTLLIQTSCLDEEKETKDTGTLKITVITADDLWGFPEFSGGICTASYSGDTSGLWEYPAVGGNPGDLECLSDQPIPEIEGGDKINIVYLYSQIGSNSKSYPVLYNGSSSGNGGVITIDEIAEGTYYVVAFYDYCSGGNQENVLKRYDRYAIYTASTDPLVKFDTANSTPYQDHASSIEIKKKETTEITLVVKKDWVLGKPKTDTSENAGRTFLVYTDGIPVP